jgi:LPXTG-motif cell wall-anchored protein
MAVALAAAPDPAAAQTVCVPNGDGTYTPVDGGAEGPGSIVIGPGESCPLADAEAVAPPVELPPEPECPSCPDDKKTKKRGDTATTGASGFTPVSNTQVERLPFTGRDSVRFALLLGGIGLLAIGSGWALRRRTSHHW